MFVLDNSLQPSLTVLQNKYGCMCVCCTGQLPPPAALLLHHSLSQAHILVVCARVCVCVFKAPFNITLKSIWNSVWLSFSTHGLSLSVWAVEGAATLSIAVTRNECYIVEREDSCRVVATHFDGGYLFGGRRGKVRACVRACVLARVCVCARVRVCVRTKCSEAKLIFS